MMARPIVSTVTMSLAAALAPASVTPAAAASNSFASQFPARVLAAHNDVRARAGVAPLAWDPALGNAAAAYAQQMALTGRFAHSDRNARQGTGENLWMGTHGAGLSKELRGRVDDAIDRSWIALVVLGALSVGREGIETALFVWANVAGGSDPVIGTLGAVLGIATAIVTSWLISKGLVRFNLSVFFTWTGLFLILVAAGGGCSALGRGAADDVARLLDARLNEPTPDTMHR